MGSENEVVESIGAASAYGDHLNSANAVLDASIKNLPESDVCLLKYPKGTVSSCATSGFGSEGLRKYLYDSIVVQIDEPDSSPCHDLSEFTV